MIVVKFQNAFMIICLISVNRFETAQQRKRIIKIIKNGYILVYQLANTIHGDYVWNNTLKKNYSDSFEEVTYYIFTYFPFNFMNDSDFFLQFRRRKTSQKHAGRSRMALDSTFSIAIAYYTLVVRQIASFC